MRDFLGVSYRGIIRFYYVFGQETIYMIEYYDTEVIIGVIKIFEAYPWSLTKGLVGVNSVHLVMQRVYWSRPELLAKQGRETMGYGNSCERFT